MDKEQLLNLEIKDRVAGVDAILSKIIKDRSTWKEFFRNPAKVLGEMGYGRPASDETAWRYNRIFYALLTHKELLQFVESIHEGILPRMSGTQVDAYYDSLKSGKIEYDPEVDVDIYRSLKNNPIVFRKLLKLSLTRINQENIFEQEYTEADIDRSIDTLMEHAKENNSLAEMVKSLPWHNETDEVLHTLAIIPPAIAVPVVAEAVACGTLACVVVPLAESGVAQQSLMTLQGDAFAGDRASIKALSTLGLLIEFISELTDHMNEFERILRA